MIVEVAWDNLWTLSFGLSQLHGHGSWPVCEVALSIIMWGKAQAVPVTILFNFRSTANVGNNGTRSMRLEAWQ